MDVLKAIEGWLWDGYGLDAAVLGEQAILKALNHRCRVLGLSDLDRYCEIWSRDLGEREALIRMFLVGETWFFRESPAFDALRLWCSVREALFTTKSGPRILVLPCATGEEAWSVAAVMKAAGLNAARIDAIDLHPEFIEFARKATYSERRLRDVAVDPLWLKALGTIENGVIRIDEGLRSMVCFEVGNAGDPELLEGRPPYDLIFCRNLLIYFHAEARRRLLTLLVGHLKADGLLFLGHAEHLPEDFGFSRDPRVGAFAWMRTPEGGRAKSPSFISRKAMPAVVPSRLKPEVQTLAFERASVLESPVPKSLSPRELADQGALQLALDALQGQGLECSLDASVHGLAGILLDALGRQEEAVLRFRRALFLDPGHAESLAHLALLLEQMGRQHEALRLRRRLDGGG